MKTLKSEEIYANEYRDLDHQREKHRRVHRHLLQSRATAFGARLQATGGVRADCHPLDDIAGSDREFFQA
jgi:hypothetical protein